MFFSNLLILGGGLLMATTSVEARAIGKLSFLPHLPFTTSKITTTEPQSPPLAAAPAQQTCAFTPHLPLRTTQSSFSIPSSAWPLLRTLLTSHIIPSSPPSSSPSTTTTDSSSPPNTQINPSQQQDQHPPLRNSVQTLHLRDFTTDASLENLILGLVFSTTHAPDASYKELRSLSPPNHNNPSPSAREMRKRGEGQGREGEGEGEGRSWTSCVEEAIRKVEEERVMEGVLELDGRGGTVGFLLYRVD